MSHAAVSDTKLAVDGDDDLNDAAAAVLTLPQVETAFSVPLSCIHFLILHTGPRRFASRSVHPHARWYCHHIKCVLLPVLANFLAAAAAAAGIDPSAIQMLPLVPKERVFAAYAAAAAAADTLVYNGGTTSLDAVSPHLAPKHLCCCSARLAAHPCVLL